MKHFDFTKTYPGITKAAILHTIDNVTREGGMNEIILATCDKPPVALIFRRCRGVRLMSGESPDDYTFQEFS